MTNEFRQALEILQGQGYDLLYIVLNISSTVIGVFLVGTLIAGFIQHKRSDTKETQYPKVQKILVYVLVISLIILFTTSFAATYFEDRIYEGIRTELLANNSFEDIRFIPEPSKEWIDAFRDSSVGSEIIVKENNRVQYYNLWLSGDEISLEKIPQRFMV